MKVNIMGKGIIPIVGGLAPIYGKEISEMNLRRLLNFNSFRVYDHESGLLITKKNISNVISSNIVTNVNPLIVTNEVKDSKKADEFESLIVEDTLTKRSNPLPEITSKTIDHERIYDPIVGESETNQIQNQNRDNNRNKNKKKHK